MWVMYACLSCVMYSYVSDQYKYIYSVYFIYLIEENIADLKYSF